jgi:plastocyanin domain-containing protein
MWIRQAIGSMAGIGLALSLMTTPATAQQSHSMSSDAATEQTSQFHRIDQPIWIKAAVTVGGLALIGLEVWWFLLSKPKSQTAEARDGLQEVTITVDGGYAPNRVVVHAGQPVRLNFLRHDPSSCLEKVVFPDFHIAQNLDLNHITPIEFTPDKPGNYGFACGMNMFRGVIEVQAAPPEQADA